MEISRIFAEIVWRKPVPDVCLLVPGRRSWRRRRTTAQRVSFSKIFHLIWIVFDLCWKNPEKQEGLSYFYAWFEMGRRGHFCRRNLWIKYVDTSLSTTQAIPTNLLILDFSLVWWSKKLHIFTFFGLVIYRRKQGQEVAKKRNNDGYISWSTIIKKGRAFTSQTPSPLGVSQYFFGVCLFPSVWLTYPILTWPHISYSHYSCTQFFF